MKTIPKQYMPGSEHTGEGWIIQVFAERRDTYPNNFKVWVRLTSRADGKVRVRRGYGKFIGNFAPIWVSLNGFEFQLTEL